MSHKLTIDLMTAEAVLLKGATAESVTAPGVEGTFQILPEHAAYLSSLEVGPVVVEGSDQAGSFVISGGFAEVADDHIRILADEAVDLSKVDRDAVQTSLKELEAEQADLDPFSDEAASSRTRQRYLQFQSPETVK